MKNESGSRFGLDPVEKRCVQLVREYQGGNAAAFDGIVSLMRGKFYYTVYKSVRDEYETEDIVQEVLIRIFRSLKDLSDPLSFKKWSYSIVNSVTLDYLKSRRVRSTGDMELGFDETMQKYDETRGGSESEIQNVERKTVVMAAVETLPQELQVIIRYRFYDNMTDEEIADVVGSSPRTIKRRLQTAKAELSGKLTGIRSVAPFLFYRIEAMQESKALLAAAGLHAGISSVQKAAVVGGVAVGAAAALVLRAPEIRDVKYYDQNQYVNEQSVEWTIDSVLPVRKVDIEGKQWKVTEENGVYCVKVPENGEFVICAENYAGLKARQHIRISNIDSAAPDFLGYEENGDGMILKFSDTLSGVNWETIDFSKENGEKAEAAAKDPGRSEVLLRKEDFPMNVRVEDYAGNYGVYSMDLHTVTRERRGGGSNAR